MPETILLPPSKVAMFPETGHGNDGAHSGERKQSHGDDDDRGTGGRMENPTESIGASGAMPLSHGLAAPDDAGVTGRTYLRERSMQVDTVGNAPFDEASAEGRAGMMASRGSQHQLYPYPPHRMSSYGSPTSQQIRLDPNQYSEGSQGMPEPSLDSTAPGARGIHPSAALPQTPAQSTRLGQSSTDPSFSMGSEFGREFARLATTPGDSHTPGGFGIPGQTPLTGASLGSSMGGAHSQGSMPTPMSGPRGQEIWSEGQNVDMLAERQKDADERRMSLTRGDESQQNIVPGSTAGPHPRMSTNVAMPPGLSGAGLIRGTDPLQPTPVVRRKDPPERKRRFAMPSPGLHYHTTTGERASSPQKRTSVKSELAEEEDPSILRYESRPGRDQSPLASRESTHSVEESARRETLTPRGMPPPPDRANPNTAPPRHGQGHHEHEPPPYDSYPTPVPSLREFPFYFDGFSAWVCRHCTHVPPYYRGVNYVWQYPHAPPNHFVDHHLRYCPGLNPSPQSLPPPPPQQQPPPPGIFSQMPYPVGMQPPGGSYPYSLQQPPPYMHHPPSQQSSPRMTRQAQHKHEPQEPFLHQQPSHHPQVKSPRHGRGDVPPSFYNPPQHLQYPEGEWTREPQNVSSHNDDGHLTSDPTPTRPRRMIDRGAPDPPTDTPHRARPKHSEEGNSTEQSELQRQQHPYYSGHAFPSQPPHPFPYPHYPPQSSLPPGHIIPPGLPHQSALHRSAPTHPPQLHPPVAGSGNTESQSPAAKPKRKSTMKSPRGRETDDTTYAQAINRLNQLASTKLEQKTSEIGATLIEESDGDLLTDYFFHMMKQLVLCRFSEKDRRTRGGKRENINIGYGGLQCLHCRDSPGSRKFFWSNVDRLANSFAEIPGHVLKCKQCPDDIKDALLILKGRHPEQMQMLQRGSQKVFFRRMWRRLHEGDDIGATPMKDGSSGNTTATDSSGLTGEILHKTSDAIDRVQASNAAARILATSTESDQESPEERGRVLLAIAEDMEWLSDMDCFVRQNIEVFSATKKDVSVAAADRKYPIKPGQVGIRCIHCAMTPEGARGAAVSYPYSISGIYESVREFQRLHLEGCANLPQQKRDASTKLEGAASLSSVLRRYYVQAARALGLFDTSDGGIKAGAEPVPMSSAGFQSPVTSYRALPGATTSTQSVPMQDTSRKRKASPILSESGRDGQPEAKRQDSKEDPSGDSGSFSNITPI